MALAPKFKGQRLLFASPAALAESAAEPLHTLELYLDYVCPYSAKIFNTFTTAVVPRVIRANPPVAGKLQVVFRHQVQPWHPSSTLVHEAGVAVQRLAPNRFWDFSGALFAAQRDFFDVSVVNETRNQTYRRLARLAAEATGGEAGEEAVYGLLAVPEKAAEDGSLNVGNAVTNDLKVLIKMARLVSVHVSPTVIFDGVVANDISSSWTEEQWSDWLLKNVV